MPPSHTPTVNYQEHFGIDNNTRRRRHVIIGGDAQDEHDSTTGTEDLSEGDDDGEDESEGDPVIEDLENLDEDIGLEDVAVEAIMDNTPLFDPAALGLKEIGNLASWTVSSSKPGCGVLALRDDDTNLFWQSDGPQPHYLNIHFAKFAKIRAIRIFLDFEADESYTPTRWIDVNLDHVGGGSDGKTLRAFIIQVKVLENHQNGKDTHVRGLKIYSHDERHESPPPSYLGEEEDDTCSSIDPNEFGGPDDDLKHGDFGNDDQFWKDFTQARMGEHKMPNLSGLSEPGFMSEPELR
ncbi:anaphase-promoting complex subunit 10 [Botrytis cinerea]